MVKILISFVAFLSTSIFLGCKKEMNSTGNYYINMNIDNKYFSFNDSLFATKQSFAPKLAIFGYSKTKGQLQWLFSDYSTGTYIDTYDTSAKNVIYQFTINAIVGYYNSTPVIEMLLRPSPAVPNAISMKITNVNSEYVEGTFSGILNTNSTITNGLFKVPFK